MITAAPMDRANYGWFELAPTLQTADERRATPVTASSEIVGNPYPVMIRDDVWTAAGKAARAELWDEAVFNAFRLVEDHIQRASGVSTIGGRLVREVFGDAGSGHPKLRLSSNAEDLQRLQELYTGALGFFKGDRSHKHTPAVPCQSETMCIRLLGVASALMDLVDLDLNKAATIVSAHTEANDLVDLLVRNASPNADVLFNGGVLPVTLRAPDLLRVRVPGEAGTLSLNLRSDGRIGPPYEYRHAPIEYEEGAAIQRVEEADVVVYSDATGSNQRRVRAVCLKGHQGGRATYRYFPTENRYVAGDYVTVAWDMTSGDGRDAWIRRNGEMNLAWTSSALFNGKSIGPGGETVLVRIDISPEAVRLRPDDRVPLRVTGTYTNGKATWYEDVTVEAQFTVDDENVAVAPGPFLRARRPGRTTVTVQVESRFKRSTVVVAGLSSGTITEYLGLTRNAVSLRRSAHGLLLADQRERILVLDPDLSMRVLAVIDKPDTAIFGIDCVDADLEGNVYFRTLWDISVRRLDASSGFTAGPRVTLGTTTPMALAWLSNRTVVVADTDGRLLTWDGLAAPEEWMRVPLFPVHMTASDGIVYVLGGPTGPGLLAIAADTRTITSLGDDLPSDDHYTSALVLDNALLVSGFHSGIIYKVCGDSTSVFAQGLLNPHSMTSDGHGGVLVAESGRNVVKRILA